MLAFVKSNRIKIAVVAAVVLLGGGAFMASSQATARKEAEAKAAAAAAPKSPFVAVANGKADVEGGMIQVAARRAGIVREVYVQEGDQVVKGQILARQEDDEPKLAAARAAAARIVWQGDHGFGVLTGAPLAERTAARHFRDAVTTGWSMLEVADAERFERCVASVNAGHPGVFVALATYAVEHGFRTPLGRDVVAPDGTTIGA